jgi:hypothetical protein
MVAIASADMGARGQRAPPREGCEHKRWHIGLVTIKRMDDGPSGPPQHRKQTSLEPDDLPPQRNGARVMNITTSNREHNNRELTDAELLAVCGGSAKAGSWHSTNKTVAN